MNPDPLICLHKQMKLEGKGLTAESIIYPLGSDGEEIPLILLSRLITGKETIYFGNALPGKVRDGICAFLGEHPFSKSEGVLARLAADGISATVGHYRTYVFPENGMPERQAEVRRLSGEDPRLKEIGFEGFIHPVYVIVQEGRAVSACVSARQNEECAESWVFTVPEHRRKGYAGKVITAWARENAESDILPFYSHRVENRISEKLAEKLELIPVFEEISIEKSKT